jgi:transcriptional regulator with XRE-family HTH domain
MQGQLMNIGEKIKQLRTDKNLTQPQLAEAIGIEQSYLSKLENDKSVPSADIFQAILKALTVDVGSFLEGIDEKIIHRQLRQIPEVANYLHAGVAYKIHNIKKWLFGSAVACVIGLTLVVAGYKSLIFPSSVFEYRSNGLVKQSEPDDLFENTNSYLMRVGCPFFDKTHDDTEECQVLRKDIRSRARQETMLLPDYRGNTIYREQADGRQVFFSRGLQFTNSPTNSYLTLLGAMLTFSGLFGFFIECRLRRI